MPAAATSANVDDMHDHDADSPAGLLPLGHRLAAHRFTQAQLLAIDVVTVVLVIIVAEFFVAPRMPGSSTGAAARVGYAGTAAVTLLRRRLPRPTLAVVLSATVASLAFRAGVGGAVFVMMALYTVVTVSPRRTALVIAGVAAGAVLAGYVIGGGTVVVPAAIGGVALVLLGWLAGENTRASRAYAGQKAERAAERAAAATEERAEQVRRAVADERAQIARELHDIVAHAMSVIAVRSGVARMVIDTDPGQAREALAIIETTTRRSLHEMRLLVGMLRDAGDQRAELSPAPGLGDLDRLVTATATAGVTVDVHVSGDVRALSPAADLSAYRIVQEALTNVVRHAGPTRARVQITYEPDQVSIEVTDEGASRPASPSSALGGQGGQGVQGGHGVQGGQGVRPGSGHGLIGMRERAALFGGELAAGPYAAGFRVQASLRTGALRTDDLRSGDIPAGDVPTGDMPTRDVPAEEGAR
jgi:signal transduction histidine kinase